jgi:alkyl sulfatase BDS1-like metallo-beta-lactamase superfamily hydrolase
MYGAALDRGPRPQRQVSAGLGATVSTGTITLIPPTVEITRTGQEEVVDGIRIVFQMAPGTEAPSEMHFYFPDFKALCEFLSVQRDLYAYLHDQTLRMINKGMVGPEIAEEIQMPPALENAWRTHGYYGSVSHNVKGVYQR